MKLKWKRDEECILTAYRCEYDNYHFHIVAANKRCVMLGVGPEQFGPFGSMKDAKQFANEVAAAIQADKEEGAA